jgi:hypothetical protein
MLTTDLLETKAGHQLYEEGLMESMRLSILDIIKMRFSQISENDTKSCLKKINLLDELKSLYKLTLKCKTKQEFTDSLYEKASKGSDPKKKIFGYKRGSDEAFLILMKICGQSVLRLLGFSEEDAKLYQFQAVVLKEKRIEPDIIGIPYMEAGGKRIFIEFQGYTDEYMRYRLLSTALTACAHDNFSGEVIMAVFYTEKKFLDKALPIQLFSNQKTTELVSEEIHEFVLPDYTFEELVAIDPKLVILAPYTIPIGTSKAQVSKQCRIWNESIIKNYQEKDHKNVKNVISLLLLNRIKDITREEVIAMFNIDLKDSVAGMQIFDEGKEEGMEKMFFQTIKQKFGNISDELTESIQSIRPKEKLSDLINYVFRCNDVDEFAKMVYVSA